MAYLTLPEARTAPGMAKRLREATVLVVDPSSGGSSQPGYAVVHEGVLQEYGIIKLPKGSQVHHRLYKLREAIADLADRYGKFDILILEKIAVAFGGGKKGKGSGIITQGVVHLHWSCGVTLASYPWPVVIQVQPQTWHAWVRNNLDEVKYKKTDANDALVMALCTFSQLLGHLPEGATLEMLQQS